MIDKQTLLNIGVSEVDRNPQIDSSTPNLLFQCPFSTLRLSFSVIYIQGVFLYHIHAVGGFSF